MIKDLGIKIEVKSGLDRNIKIIETSCIKMIIINEIVRVFDVRNILFIVYKDQ